MSEKESWTMDSIKSHRRSHNLGSAFALQQEFARRVEVIGPQRQGIEIPQPLTVKAIQANQERSIETEGCKFQRNGIN
jgi:hypothetical protein